MNKWTSWLIALALILFILVLGVVYALVVGHAFGKPTPPPPPALGNGSTKFV